MQLYFHLVAYFSVAYFAFKGYIYLVLIIKYILCNVIFLYKIVHLLLFWICKVIYILFKFIIICFAIGERPSSTFGVLELGGASTQIVFVPKGNILADKFPITIGGITYPLYVHSYLYYGQNMVDKWIKEQLYKQNPGNTTLNNPCMLPGMYRYYFSWFILAVVTAVVNNQNIFLFLVTFFEDVLAT